jgi:hypothetical protein
MPPVIRSDGSAVPSGVPHARPGRTPIGRARSRIAAVFLAVIQLAVSAGLVMAAEIHGTQLPSTTAEDRGALASFPTRPFLSYPKSGRIVKDGGSRVVIENVSIDGGSVHDPRGIGITIRNVTGSITIRNVDLADLEGGIYIYNSTGTIRIENVRSRNIGTGRIGAGRSNHIQIAESSLSGRIRYNQFLGGRTEDMVSTWHAGGRGVGAELIVERNKFQGLVADTSKARAWTSTSGTGIIIGDGGGSPKNGHVIVRYNTFLTPGQVGIQHIDGPGLQTYGNRIYGERRPKNNNPISSWEGTPRGIVRDNRYEWYNEDGRTPAPWLHPGNRLSLANNVFDRSLTRASMRIIFP